MKKSFLFLLTIFIVASCTITEKVVFNAKNGGDISYEVDATEFVGFMAMADTTGNGFSLGDSLADLAKATETLKTIKGIKNVNFKSEQTKMFLSFSFDDLDAFNKAHRELGKQTENNAAKDNDKVTVKSKKDWVYRILPIGESKDDSVYSTMGMMLTYKLDATFPKNIKETSSKTITPNNNQIFWTSSAEDAGAAYAFDGITVSFK